MAARAACLMLFLSLLSCVLVKVQSRLGGSQENAEQVAQHANWTGVVSYDNQSNQSVDGPPPLPIACTHYVYSWTGAKCGGRATCCTIGIDNRFGCATSEGCYEGAPCFADGKFHVWPLGGKEHGCRRRSVLPPVPPPVPPRPTPTPAPTPASTTTTTIMSTTTTTTTCDCCIDEAEYEESEDNEESEDTVSDRKLMVNGEDLVATGQWKNQYDWVVRIRVGDEQLPDCTGTLWNNYVLTAAHCFPEGTVSGQPMKGCVSRGPGTYRQGKPPKFKNIAQIVRVRAIFAPEQDIAIVELKQRPKVTGLPIKFTTKIPKKDARLFMVGYGENIQYGSFEPQRGTFKLVDQHYYFLDPLQLKYHNIREWTGGAWARKYSSSSNVATTGGDSGGPWFTAPVDSTTGPACVIFAVHQGGIVGDVFPEDAKDVLQWGDEVLSPFRITHPFDDGVTVDYPYPQDPVYTDGRAVSLMRQLGFPFDGDDTDESFQYSQFTTSSSTNATSATGKAKDSAMISGCYGKAALAWNFAVIGFLMYF